MTFVISGGSGELCSHNRSVALTTSRVDGYEQRRLLRMPRRLRPHALPNGCVLDWDISGRTPEPQSAAGPFVEKTHLQGTVGSSSWAGYLTMSFRDFSGRIRTTLRAGLALNIISWPVNGLMPLRGFVAGLC